jgi:RNA polymerase sigma-70 factor (ECF subfamily)
LVEQLPAVEREAVRARVVEERSYREIATELRCSEMVIRKRVSRGLARVRKQLNET